MWLFKRSKAERYIFQHAMDRLRAHVRKLCGAITQPSKQRGKERKNIIDRWVFYLMSVAEAVICFCFFNRFLQKPYCVVGSFLPRYATINSASLPVPASWMGLRYHSIGGGKEKMLVRKCTVALLLHQIRRKIERYSCELFSSAVGTDSSRPHFSNDRTINDRFPRGHREWLYCAAAPLQS